MPMLTNKLSIRYSSPHADFNTTNPNKSSSFLSRTFAAKRLNTEGDSKPAHSKYLLKKGSKMKTTVNNNHSKENLNSYRASDFLNRISFDFDWNHQNHQASLLHKKSALKHSAKGQELNKMLKNRNLRKTNIGQKERKSENKNKLFDGLINMSGIQERRTINKNNSAQKLFQNKHQLYQISLKKLLGCGTFGKVYSAVNKITKQEVAIKQVFNDKAYKNRQVQLMQMTKSQFVIPMIDQFTTTQTIGIQTKEYINIVMPKYQSSLFDFLKQSKYQISPKLLKLYLYQMFRGILHLHSNKICHRDLKPQNMLIKENKLSVCDLDSAKILKKGEQNISYICSRCYRAPQLIFGATQYNVSIDMWSAGCIIIQILNKNPFFIAKDSLHHLIQIMKVMGTPSKKDVLNMNPNYDVATFSLPKIRKTQWENIFVQADPHLLDMVSKIMVYDPNSRLSVGEALAHQYFDEVRTRNFFQFFGPDIQPKHLFTFNQCKIDIIQISFRFSPKTTKQFHLGFGNEGKFYL